MFIFTTRHGGKTWIPQHTVQANQATDDKDAVWLCNGLVNSTTWNYYVDPFEGSANARHYR